MKRIEAATDKEIVSLSESKNKSKCHAIADEVRRDERMTQSRMESQQMRKKFRFSYQQLEPDSILGRAVARLVHVSMTQNVLVSLLHFSLFVLNSR